MGSDGITHRSGPDPAPYVEVKIWHTYHFYITVPGLQEQKEYHLKEAEINQLPFAEGTFQIQRFYSLIADRISCLNLPVLVSWDDGPWENPFGSAELIPCLVFPIPIDLDDITSEMPSGAKARRPKLVQFFIDELLRKFARRGSL